MRKCVTRRAPIGPKSLEIHPHRIYGIGSNQEAARADIVIDELTAASMKIL